MLTYEKFLQNLNNIEENISKACQLASRKRESILLLPVTKYYPPEIIQYVLRANLKSVGESRVQDTLEKKPQIPGPLQWELIGHLQSNKASIAIETFDRIQSVDSIKLLTKLNSAAALKNITFPILLQVNAGNDPAKFGVSLTEIDQLLESALTLKNLQIQGLMTIPPLSADITIAQKTFDTLRNTRDRLSTQFQVPLPHLSMGMSTDYPQAIQAGSTIIRIGKALFTEEND